MAKYKKLTNKEKAEKARVKKELQKKGVLPPNKPRLNRKKFVEEAFEEWNNRPECYIWEHYLLQAFGFILMKRERGNFGVVSLEAVGAAKVIKLAIRLRQFDMKLEDEGRTKYNVMEQLEYIQDILDA